MDLHMEHLNRTFKSFVAHLGPNIIGPSLQRTGRAMKPLHDVQLHFDHVTNVTAEFDYKYQKGFTSYNSSSTGATSIQINAEASL